VTYRVQVRLPADKVQYPRVAERAQGSPVSLGTRPLRYLVDDEIEAQQYGRGSLGCGDRIEGLAIIREGLSTTLILPGQVATVGAFGELRVTRKADRG
jgi:N-methylhydantoinase A